MSLIISEQALDRASLAEFSVFGAFELVLYKGSSGRVIDPEASRSSIEEQMDEQYPNDNLHLKPGCYVFATRTGGRGSKSGCYLPWYVGKAKKQSLLKESLGNHQIQHYGRVLADYERCTPVVFLVAKSAPGHVKAVDDGMLTQMETRLIEYAFERNPHLRNDRKVPRLGFAIQGVPLMGRREGQNRGRRSDAARDFARMLNIC
jgi:hypothetical protein